MNNENVENQSQSQEAKKPLPKQSSFSVWGFIKTVFRVIGVVFVVIILFSILGLLAAIVTGRQQGLVEKVIYEGPHTAKIAVINLEGMIEDSTAEDVIKQLAHARRDKNVRGIILRVNSPGGTISATDRIYHQLMVYQEDTGLPAVAFQQGLAASGGYYASVACPQIIAEPTTLTGSIGVIMANFVVQQLLEDKLGVVPVVVKAGAKKDWISPFHSPTPEELDYINDRLVMPAYERFVAIVAAGRKNLAYDKVKALADGSIYTASQALDSGLIDKIGYLEDAYDKILELAELDEAKMVEYENPFSLGSLLSPHSQGALKFDIKSLYELGSAKLMYLWMVY
jgi:protease-4